MYAYYLFKKLNLKNKNPTNSQNLKAVKLESASHVQRAWSRRSPQRESFSGREESTFKIRIFVLFFFFSVEKLGSLTYFLFKCIGFKIRWAKGQGLTVVFSSLRG